MQTFYIFSLLVKVVEQSTAYSCGAAVIEMILSTKGTEKKDINIYTEIGENPKEGVTVKEIISYLKKQGIEVLRVLKKQLKRTKKSLSYYLKKYENPIVLVEPDHV